MITAEENELMTKVGPGTPAGELLRRYWHPVAIAADLTPDSPTKFVRILGEDLVLFQTPNGEVGLLHDRCAHRGVSLSYGRVEERGIACAYHGWLYDTKGNCLETPAEPADSKFCLTVKQKAYPVKKLAGLYWAYFGPAAGAGDSQIRCLGAHGRLALAARLAAARLQLAASDGKFRRHGASAYSPSGACDGRFQSREHDPRHHRQSGQITTSRSLPTALSNGGFSRTARSRNIRCYFRPSCAKPIARRFACPSTTPILGSFTFTSCRIRRSPVRTKTKCRSIIVSRSKIHSASVIPSPSFASMKWMPKILWRGKPRGRYSIALASAWRCRITAWSCTVKCSVREIKKVQQNLDPMNVFRDPNHRDHRHQDGSIRWKWAKPARSLIMCRRKA